MPFLSITTALMREQADVFGDLLMEEGAISVSVVDADEGTPAERAIFGEPGATSGLWDRCQLTALFMDGADGVEAMWRVAAHLDIETLNFAQSTIDDTDWVRENQAQFPPIQVSDHITIVPTWHEASMKDGDKERGDCTQSLNLKDTHCYETTSEVTGISGYFWLSLSRPGKPLISSKART